VPLVPTDDPDDFDWYPLQYHFGLSGFGINAFGGDAATAFVHEHDERESDQEELYVVVKGTARFTLDGEVFDAPAVSVVAIRNPSVRRQATAIEDGTLILAIGAPAGSGFATTWRAAHFEHVPRAD
jgi:mannose-6-phosphate isomerase-like protein (cupin superfamily)